MHAHCAAVKRMLDCQRTPVHGVREHQTVCARAANSFHTCRCVLSVSPAPRMRPKPLLALPRRRPGRRPMPRRAPQGVLLRGRVAAPRRCHDDQDVRQRRLLASTAPCRAHPSRIAPPRASPRASPLARPRHTPYALLMQASAVGAALPLPPLSSSSSSSSSSTC